MEQKKETILKMLYKSLLTGIFRIRWTRLAAPNPISQIVICYCRIETGNKIRRHSVDEKKKWGYDIDGRFIVIRCVRMWKWGIMTHPHNHLSVISPTRHLFDQFLHSSKLRGNWRRLYESLAFNQEQKIYRYI